MDTLTQLPPTSASLDLQMKILAERYVLHNFIEIREYLASRQYLNGILLEACERIEEIFGKGTRLILDLVHFNDYPDSQELFVRIETPLSAERAYPLLTRLDDEWWLNASDRVNHLITFTLEYV